jgi:hypothetical protein
MMWDMVRRNPNVAPDAQRRTLFGPGVPALTREKAISPMSACMGRP